MRDKFTPVESEHPGPDDDSTAGKSRPGDVDQMVFSFLSELNTLSDALAPARDKPAEGNDAISIAADRSNPLDVQPAALKPYRNIDVLLMDNRQNLAGKERARDELPRAVPGLFESQSATRFAGASRRRMRMLICATSVTLLGTLAVLFYFELSQSIDRKDIAAPVHASSPSPPSKAGAPALPPETVSPAVAIEKVIPRYPSEAVKLGVQGTVVFDTDVDERGRVTGTFAVSGPLMLRPAAAEALRRWRFKPAQRDGVNLKSTTRVSVVFKR